MSTVVQYKGSMIADISKSYIDDGYYTYTKNLLTANTYCEDNIKFTNYNPDRSDLCQPKDVDFIDFDGRLVYSYTKAQFLALSAMPANPSYPHLVAQGWNWTLADAKTFVTQHGALVIGQNYTTDSGKTRIYITISNDLVEGGFSTVPLYINLPSSPAANFDINWGDGTVSQGLTTGTNQSASNCKHTYTKAGDYVIEVTVNSGGIRLGYWGANNTIVGTDMKYKLCVTRVEIGSGVIGLCRNVFYQFHNLKYVSIPITCCQNNDTGTDYSMFSGINLTGIVLPSGMQQKDYVIGRYGGSRDCIRLRYLSIPKSMGYTTTAEPQVHSLRKMILPSCSTLTINLGYAYNLTHFVAPGTYTSIPINTCCCSQISSLTIPASVTSIANGAFNNNYKLTEVHLLPTTPPTLANSQAFTVGAPAGRIYYVPYSSDHSVLNAYKTASQWSNLASQIQEEPQ